MSDPIQEMAAKLLEQLHTKVQALKETSEMQEVLKLHRALNALEEITQPGTPTTLASVFGLGAEPEAAGSAVPRFQLKPWEFTGLLPLEAAKKYLKLAGEPRSISDIADAINRHGGSAGSIDHLKTSLTRSTLDIVKVGEDMYGPIEFFPHIKRSGKPKKKTGATNGASVEEDDGEDVEQPADEAEAPVVRDEAQPRPAEGPTAAAADGKEGEA